MSKKFIDFLKGLDSNELVYVGTKDGSNWIVIETAQTVIENMDKLEHILHCQVHDTYAKAQDKLDTIPYSIVDVRKEIGECDSDEKMKELKVKLANLERAFVASYMTREKYKKALDTWIKLDDRPVLNTYEHKTDHPGTSIILSGIERGTLWFKGEKKVI